MRSTKVIHVVSCHAEGEVGDVIVGGVAPPPGDTIWDQARWIAADETLRNFVLNEPRGGVFRHVVSGSVPEGDASKPFSYAFGSKSDVSIGARLDCGPGGRLAPSNVFNGKIDGPKLYRTASDAVGGANAANLIAAWDFSQGIDTWHGFRAQ